MSSSDEPADPLRSAPRPGDVLAGKYRVERVLGVGGMGVVVAAEHLQLGERVALKFLLADALTSPDAVARFTREARAAVRIKSEHVARVTDVGTLDGNVPYMVMEYLEGGDLADRLTKTGPLLVEHAVEFLLQACEAVAEAHSLGIVHRDLKPANLFLTHRRDGSPIIKVLDFGISKVLRSEGGPALAALTNTHAVMGSPLYMSPEQLRSSREVDERTDIWALGAILYELVTGIPPFDGETLPQLCMQIMAEPPPRLSTILPDAPPGLEEAILKALEKLPAGRYANVGELAAAIVPFGPPRGEESAARISRLVGDPALRRSAVMSRASAVPAPSTVPVPQEGPDSQASTRAVPPVTHAAASAVGLDKTEQSWAPIDTKAKERAGDGKPLRGKAILMGAAAALVAAILGARILAGSTPTSTVHADAVSPSAESRVSASAAPSQAMLAPDLPAPTVTPAPTATAVAPAASVPSVAPVNPTPPRINARPSPPAVVTAAPVAPRPPEPNNPPPQQSPLDVHIH